MAQLDCSQGLNLLNQPLGFALSNEAASAYAQGFVVNTGNNATAVAEIDLLNTFGIPLLTNTRIFVISNGRIVSTGDVYVENENAVSASIWGQEGNVEEVNGVEAGAELEFYIISGTQIFILDNPSGISNEPLSSTYEDNQIFMFRSDSAVAWWYCDIQLSDFSGISDYINKIQDLINDLTNQVSDLETQVWQLSIQAQQNDLYLSQNESLLAQIDAKDDIIADYIQEVFDISEEYGNYVSAQQDAVANAHAEGVASVDITSDNQAVYEAAFLEGADSQEDAVAQAYEAGAASVDITSDNEPLESIITLQEAEIESLEGIAEGLQDGISALETEVQRLTQLVEQGELTEEELLAAQAQIVQLETILDAFNAEEVTPRQSDKKNTTLLYAALGVALIFTLTKK